MRIECCNIGTVIRAYGCKFEIVMVLFFVDFVFQYGYLMKVISCSYSRSIFSPGIKRNIRITHTHTHTRAQYIQSSLKAESSFALCVYTSYIIRFIHMCKLFSPLQLYSIGLFLHLVDLVFVTSQ